MHEIHDVSDFRLYEDYGMSLPSVGQRLIFVFSWAHCDSTWVVLKLLTVSELRTNFFVSWQYVYIFDCFPVAIHWMSKEAFTRA